MNPEDFDVFGAATQRSAGKWMTWKTVGDAIKGTYIDKFEKVDGYGNPQIVYVLKNSAGQYNVGFRKTTPQVHDEMARVKFGNVVGFRFDEEKNTKAHPTGIKAKIIRAYVDPKMIDQTWVKDNAVLDEAVDALKARNASANTSSDGLSNAFDTVRQLARDNGLVSADEYDDETDAAVKTFTGLDLNSANIGTIIVKLNELRK